MKQPILIADGARGIYAARFAAQNIERMIREKVLRHNGHTVTLANIVDAGSFSPTEPAEGERHTEAWDAVTRGVFYMDFTDDEEGTEYRIHEDAEGIFLVPDGYELEQA